MNKDAEIAERVMREMARATGIVPLAVHDSFIVPASQRSKLMETMERAINGADSLVEAPPILETCLPLDLVKETPEALPQYGTGEGYGLVAAWMGPAGWYGFVVELPPPSLPVLLPSLLCLEQV
jgi:hypothetical protein